MKKVKMIHNGTLKAVLMLVFVLAVMALTVSGCSPKSGTPSSGENTTPAATNAPAEQTATNSAGKDAGAAKECMGCHEMWPEVYTWQTSVHAKVPCTTCHAGYNPTQNSGAHDSGSFAKPIRIQNPVTDEACNSCHSMENRLATLLPDLKAPHEKHAAGKISCLSCHRFVTHGNIAERKITTRAEYADYSHWNEQLATKAAPQVQRRPNMFVCINCHESKKVTTACAACHYLPERASLPSHENAEWKVVHGKSGRQDVNNCAKCHYDKESQKFATPSTGDKIADFARANSYCYGCHTKRPANHDGQWMSKHSTFAKERGLLNCFACHDKQQPPAGSNVTGIYCNTCHWFAGAR